MIETLHDPLTHMLRNSIDHGTEAPEVRIKKGKPAAGRISIKARTEGNQVVIEVADDGSGSDVKAIKERVVERGMMSRAEADAMSVEGAVNFIFVPGPSTAKSVSSVSGRGVGMDVVKTNIERMNGHVYMESEEGKRTKLTMTLPLTLAIMKALLVGVKDELYAVPLNAVLEVVKAREGLVKTVGGQEVLLLRETIIPLIALSKIATATKEPEEEGSIVICRGPDRSIGLLVGSVVGREEVVIKSLGEFLKGVKGVAGATIRGDGKVALILDLAGVIAGFFKQRVAA